MNKAELVEKIAEISDLPKGKADAALNAITETITTAMKEGDTVQILGFGSFGISQRAERTGRNPQTGESITIKASTAVKFKAGKALKDAVNS